MKGFPKMRCTSAMRAAQALCALHKRYYWIKTSNFGFCPTSASLWGCGASGTPCWPLVPWHRIAEAFSRRLLWLVSIPPQGGKFDMVSNMLVQCTLWPFSTALCQPCSLSLTPLEPLARAAQGIALLVKPLEWYPWFTRIVSVDS